MESQADAPAVHPIVRELLKIETPPQKSDKWYEERDRKLTASDVPAAIGDNPYQSRDKLLRKKLGDARYVFKGNAATAWGNENESIAADEYCRRTGRTRFEFGLLTHPIYPWLAGSPDGITADGILMEIKCPMKREIRHEIPAYYVGQVQTLLEILNLEIAHFIQFRPETTWTPMVMDILTIRRDRNWFRRKLPLMKSFYDEWMTAVANGGLKYLDRGGFCDNSDSSAEPSPKRAKVEIDIELDVPWTFPFLSRPDLPVRDAALSPAAWPPSIEPQSSERDDIENAEETPRRSF